MYNNGQKSQQCNGGISLTPSYQEITERQFAVEKSMVGERVIVGLDCVSQLKRLRLSKKEASVQWRKKLVLILINTKVALPIVMTVRAIWLFGLNLLYFFIA